MLHDGLHARLLHLSGGHLEHHRLCVRAYSSLTTLTHNYHHTVGSCCTRVDLVNVPLIEVKVNSIAIGTFNTLIA
jgi:hypothetical protein